MEENLGSGRVAPAKAASAIVALSAIALAGCAFAAFALAGCGMRKPPARPAPIYPYSAAEQRAFYATPDGLSESPRPTVPPGERLLASRAPNASVLSSNGSAIVAAVNGWGVARIEASPDAAASRGYRVVGEPMLPAFAGLTTGGAWPIGGGFLIQLFRDPFSEDQAPASHLLPAPPTCPTRLAFLDGGGLARPLDPFPADLGPGFELFAFLPSDGRWFAELRKDGSTRVDLKFITLSDPLAAAQASPAATPGAATATNGEIGRAEFEAALKPKCLASLGGKIGESLRSALGALGSGPWLVRFRSGSGEDGWYISAGKPEEALSAFAWSEPERTLALRSDGWLASSDARGRLSLSEVKAPVPEASFTALAAAGGLAAAAWESGEFPYIAQAGLVIAPLPR
jgi:hypothetical protein